MSEQPDNEARRHVAAFADGELDVEQSLRVLERMAMDPRMTRRVLHQQQLRQRTANVMREPGQAPPELRAQIEQMVRDTPTPSETAAPAGSDESAAPTDRTPGQTPDRAPGVVARLGRWMPTAAAAVLLLAAMLAIGLGWLPGAPRGGPAGGAGADLELAAAQVADFGRRHVQCSRGLADLMNADRFPTQVKTLPGALRQYFNGAADSMPTLDLSVLGYQYERTGECRVPGGGAVHVMYQARPGVGHDDALSLWIRPDDGRLELTPGRLYVAADERAAHPLLIWQHGELVYYLAGDSMRAVERAANHLRRGDSAVSSSAF